MYSSFHIKNFRGFEDFQIDGLQRINLIAGQNNTGKTTLLEAIYLHGTGSVLQVINLQEDRGFDPAIFDPNMPVWKSLFFEQNEGSEIEITGIYQGVERKIRMTAVQATETTFDLEFLENGRKGKHLEADRLLRWIRDDGSEVSDETLIQQSRGFTVKNPLEPTKNTRFIRAHKEPYSDLASLFGQLAKRKQESFVAQSLTSFTPQVSELTTVFFDRIPVMYTDIGTTERVPLNMLGDGIVRLTQILLSIGTSENGVVLIDEIENGFHYGIMGKVWQAIAQAARDFDVQVFATTHSLEMIRAAHEAFKDNDPYDFAYHRLDRNRDGQIEALTFDDEMLEATVAQNFEVRG